jgi:bis(5'-nucleosyl)-tetraphosphatase (symmetrical)
MAVYAIGDIQGCYTPFSRLLERIRFDPGVDRLWIAGDLVNRGPHSAEVVRLVRSLGEAAVTVLGNHDLYLLMVAERAAPRTRDDTLGGLLAAADREELLGWLTQRPMVHVEDGHILVHAGLVPQWDVARAAALGREVEAALRGPRAKDFLKHLYGDKPARWNDNLKGWERLRFIVNVMTRMRFCSPEGKLALDGKGPPSRAPSGSVPWFRTPNAAWRTHTVVCGHWSALGFHREPGLIALDSGCVWGGKLTAVRIDDGVAFQEDGQG